MSRYGSSSRPYEFCGCWYNLPNTFQKRYLPQAELESHTTILATTSKTVLKQTFVNTLNEVLEEVSYTFPLYDGVSVGGFQCKVANRVIVGTVKERNQARADFDEAVSRGHIAGLLEQNADAADVFSTSIGNIPAREKILIEITYLGELKNDAETDGARFTIPTQIAPRYGTMSLTSNHTTRVNDSGGIKITVDVQLEAGNPIRGIQSPSHPISITMGKISTSIDDDDKFENNLGSSSLTLGSTELDKDFVVVVQAKDQDTPRALLETHPAMPTQRVLMTTLVPKFNIPNENPEIVFVVDRSGSMGGKMHLVIEALKVFLKSLPVSVKFNICSFGSHHNFLFTKSKTYDAASLQAAMDHIQPRHFDADFGGTEMLAPITEVLKRRYKDSSLEVMLLTDGEIWNQELLFSKINEASGDNARFFTLGIGSSASSSLVEGIARAGRGFAQWVNDGERIDKRIVRMLKAALTPHIKYKIELKYAAPHDSDEDDFEIVESFEKSMRFVAKEDAPAADKASKKKKIISLFNSSARDEPTNPTAGRYDHLPFVSIPNVLQTPHNIPELYPHSRTTIYLLLGPDSQPGTPTSVILRGAYKDSDLELEIPVQDVGKGDAIHQLAAKKAMQELEEGRGWLMEALTTEGKNFKTQNESKWDLIIEREAVRLGTTFQVGGKYCSFIAIDKSNAEDTMSLGSSGQQPDLQRHQMQLMLLEQQNKKRLMMARQAPSAPLYGGAVGGNSGTMFGASKGFSHSAASSTSPSRKTRSAQFMNVTMAASPRSLFGSAQPLAPPPAPASSSSLFGSANSQPAPQASGIFGRAMSGSQARSLSPQIHMQNQMQQASHPFAGSNVFGASANQQVSFGAAPPPPQPDQHAVQFNLDFSTLEKTDVIENFDFDTFLNNPAPALAPPAVRIDDATLAKYQREMEDSACMPLPDQDSEDDMIDYSDEELAAKGGSTSRARGSTSTKLESPRPLERMQKIIAFQSFSGSWSITNELLAILSHNAIYSFKNRSALRKMVSKAIQNSANDGDAMGDDLNDNVVATVATIAWLEVVMPEEKDVWEMVVDKARGWLEGEIDGSEAVEKLIQGMKSCWRIE